MKNKDVVSVGKQRVKWVDELKGSILVLIFLGHLYGMVSTPPRLQYIAETLSAIRVPAFFFLSGLLYKAKGSEFKSYFKRKTNSLLIPYLMLSLLFTVLDPYVYCPQFLMKNMHYPRFAPLFPAPIQASSEFLCGDVVCTLVGISSRAVLPLWFVFVLYFVTIAYHWLQLRMRSRYSIGLVSILAFILAMLLSYLGVGGILKIGPCLMALFFYWSGTLFTGLQRRVEASPVLLLLPAATVLFCLFAVLVPDVVEQVGFVNGVFPTRHPVFFLLCSFSGLFGFILSYVCLSRFSFRGYDGLKGILRNIARNSLVILAMHYWGLVFFRLFILPMVPADYQMFTAIVFTIVVCMLSIALFRTHLYMFIGGKRARQGLRECFSLK